MKCPVCDGPMREVQKLGIQMDICTECKGIWLDRGELEKVIEYVGGGAEPADPRRAETPRREDPPRDRPRDDDHDRHDRDDRDKGQGQVKKRKESWIAGLGDMFGGGGD
jgi:Zn-finger nucleic acid-binding protein